MISNRRHNQSPLKQRDNDSTNDFIVLSDDDSTPSPTKRSRDFSSSSVSTYTAISAKKSKLISDSGAAICGRNVSELSEEDQLKWALKESKRDTPDRQKRKAQSSNPRDIDLSDWITSDDTRSFGELLSDGNLLSAAEATENSSEQFNYSDSKLLDSRVGSCRRESVGIENIVGTEGSLDGESLVFSKSQKETNLKQGTRERSGQLNNFDTIPESEGESNTQASMGFNSEEIAQAIAQSLEVQVHIVPNLSLPEVRIPKGFLIVSMFFLVRGWDIFDFMLESLKWMIISNNLKTNQLSFCWDCREKIDADKINGSERIT